MNNTLSQALFFRIRAFEESYKDSPAYVMVNDDHLVKLKEECFRVLKVEGDDERTFEFMGVKLIPTDKIDNFYLVAKCAI